MKPILFSASLAIFARALVSVIFAFVAMLTVSQFPGFLQPQMDADAMTPADYTWNVLHHSYAWSSFQLSPNLSFFPDMVMFGLFQIVLNDYRWAMFAFAFFMFLGLSYVCGWFAVLVSESGSPCRPEADLAVKIRSRQSIARKLDFFSAVFVVEAILAVLFLVDAASSTTFKVGDGW